MTVPYFPEYKSHRSISRTPTKVLAIALLFLLVRICSARETRHAAKWKTTALSVARGHHVYKSTWTPLLGQTLDVQAESGNRHDRYTVST